MNEVTLPDNWIYYAEVGNGVWTGTFKFRITNWQKFWASRLGFWNSCFAILNHFTNRILGKSQIHSVLTVHPCVGRAGIVTNVVVIRKLRIVLYKLEERYVLHTDGHQVYVRSKERFGPISFLFKRIKHHPARIYDGGKRSTYLDMPILGSIWTGEYSVNETNNAIDATLTCEWAVGSEQIVKKSAGSPAKRVIFVKPKDIHEVILVLERYRNWFDLMKDPRATFAHSYLEMTRIFARQIPKADFIDRAWIYELDVKFAMQYLEALHDYEDGKETGSAWKDVFDKSLERWTSVLEDLVSSMVAHIVQDLPRALYKSSWRHHPEDERIHDFHLANDILGDAIDKIQEDVSKRYNPFLKWLDQFGKGDDEILTNYGIRVCRGMAWYNTVRMLGMPEQVDESLPRSVQVFLKSLITPPFSTRFLFRIMRFASKLSRRWPEVKVSTQVKYPPVREVPSVVTT